jgi:hypothetical protein
MRMLASSLVLGCLVLAGCGRQAPTQPAGTAPAKVQSSTGAAVQTALSQVTRPQSVTAPAAGRTAPGRPGYEEAYYGGQTYMINAIEVPGKAPEQAQADFYEVVYPIGWENLGIGTPQCNPCDHEGNGIDFTDYHDHVLDSVPSSPGHGEYKAPWHVYAVVPAYSGDSGHDAQVSAAYATHIPAKSEGAIDDLLATKMPDGSPVAVKIDAHFYFLCAVVDPHAAP